MIKLSIAAAAASVLALSAGAAAAQAIQQRVDNLYERIDSGLRSGEITNAEAAELRDATTDVSELEDRYRVGGFTSWERSDLDRRIDALSARITDELDGLAYAPPASWYDSRGAWVSINRRQENLDRRIDRGLASGRLTAAEAARLRAEFRDIARMETRYRVGGLANWERADLDRRFDRLSDRIRLEANDYDRYGALY